MSSQDAADTGTGETTDEQRQTLADAFGRDLDPLTEFAPTFETTDVDPFEMFVSDVLNARGLSPRTEHYYEATFEQWHDHMAREGRHPACPNESHIKRFIQHELGSKGNHPRTVKKKLRQLVAAFEHWQEDSAFPHPHDYNPFNLARSKISFDAPELKEPPRVPVNDLRRVLDGVTNVRDRAIIIIQLKLGLRASEVCNI
jgi:site-specific recombinase XerC